jgi:hypothetical protein
MSVLPYNFSIVDKINSNKEKRKELTWLLKNNFFTYLPLIKREFEDKDIKYVLSNLEFNDSVFISKKEYDDSLIEGFIKQEISFYKNNNMYDTKSFSELKDTHEKVLTSLLKVCNKWSVEQIIKYIIKNNDNVKYKYKQMLFFVLLFREYKEILKDYLVKSLDKYIKKFNKRYPCKSEEDIVDYCFALLAIDEENIFLDSLEKNIDFAVEFFCEFNYVSYFYLYNLFFSFEGYVKLRSIYKKIKPIFLGVDTGNNPFFNKRLVYHLRFPYNDMIKFIITASETENVLTEKINNMYSSRFYIEDFVFEVRSIYREFDISDFLLEIRKRQNESFAHKSFLNFLKIFHIIFDEKEESKAIAKLKNSSFKRKDVEYIINNYKFLYKKNRERCLKILECKKR